MEYAFVGKKTGKIYVYGSEEFCFRTLSEMNSSSFSFINTSGVEREYRNAQVYPEPLIKARLETREEMEAWNNLRA